MSSKNSSACRTSQKELIGKFLQPRVKGKFVSLSVALCSSLITSLAIAAPASFIANKTIFEHETSGIEQDGSRKRKEKFSRFDVELKGKEKRIENSTLMGFTADELPPTGPGKGEKKNNKKSFFRLLSI
jgi:hypothetical protein